METARAAVLEVVWMAVTVAMAAVVAFAGSQIALDPVLGIRLAQSMWWLAPGNKFQKSQRVLSTRTERGPCLEQPSSCSHYRHGRRGRRETRTTPCSLAHIRSSRSSQWPRALPTMACTRAHGSSTARGQTEASWVAPAATTAAWLEAASQVVWVDAKGRKDSPVAPKAEAAMVASVG